MTSKPSSAYVDEADLAQFERLGEAWWDERGPMAALHRINPLRIRYIRDRLTAHFGATAGGDTDRGALPLAGLSILDIGCGGGLLAEPLTRLGARVTGIDPAPGNIAAARAHAAGNGLDIDYRSVMVEDLVPERAWFDVVVASEVVEHTRDQPGFVATAGSLVRPGGLFLASTLNRTAKSFLLAIVGAEYVLGWLPRGTHDWRRFVRPAELARWLRPIGFTVVDQTGMIFDPLAGGWRLGRDTDVNYWLTAAQAPSRDA